MLTGGGGHQALLAVIVATLLMGCGTALGPRTYQVIFPATAAAEAVSLAIADHTRLVDGVRLAADREAPDGVTNPHDREDQLVVTWLGGLCDRAARATVVAGPLDTLRIEITTDRADACFLAGITRSVVLDLAVSIAAERVVLIDLDRPPDEAVEIP